MIVLFILLFALVLLIVFPNIYWKSEPLILNILYNCLLFIFAFFSFLLLLKYIQIAIVSERGVDIKNLYGTIGRIYWKDISSLNREKIITHSSRAVISFDWIVIRTEEGQVVHDGAENKRNNPPWQIIYTKKNISIIKESLKQYRPDLHIETYDPYKVLNAKKKKK